ncbi:ETFB lysine methyltransferase [Azospirillaceae bacterium]
MQRQVSDSFPADVQPTDSQAMASPLADSQTIDCSSDCSSDCLSEDDFLEDDSHSTDSLSSLHSIVTLLNDQEKDIRAFILTATTVISPALTPEIRMCLASEAAPLWHATESFMKDSDLPPPYWAFAWPGGQAVARYILDHPELFRHRVVIDVAAGGGVIALAAAQVGAERVIGFDTDLFALTAMEINAALNGVEIEAYLGDALAPRALEEVWGARMSNVPVGGADVLPSDAVIVAGDVFYEQPMADRFFEWLKSRAAEGRTVISGDPGRTYARSGGLTPLACYEVPTSRDVEASEIMSTMVWRWTGAEI